eukprot:GCRY01000747.1.p1 GENE.GCRY01000747.1~~GCRY01000747.1.p1  ORF type:complete len:300 (+),score=25.08 GCRY01000747.1:111-1010(+)
MNQKQQRATKYRRGAVSAEPPKMGEEKVEELERLVIPKDDVSAKRLMDALKRFVMFTYLDEEQQNAVFDAMIEKRVSAGETVIQQGEQGDYFYVIEEGTLDIFVKRPGKPSEKVLTVTNGDYFGELSLMYSAPRAATVKAVRDCKLWAIDRQHYRHILMKSQLEKRDRYVASLRKVPILESLEDYEIATIADALIPVSFKKGDIIMRQGDHGDDFFIILEGNVKCTAGTSHCVIGELKENDYFGEIALLTDSPRRATVEVESDFLKAIKLSRDRFNRLLGPCEEVLRRNMDLYKTYMSI